MAQLTGLDGYNLAVLHKYLALPLYKNRVKMEPLFLLPDFNIGTRGAALQSTITPTIYPETPTLDPYEYPVSMFSKPPESQPNDNLVY